MGSGLPGDLAGGCAVRLQRHFRGKRGYRPRSVLHLRHHLPGAGGPRPDDLQECHGSLRSGGAAMTTSSPIQWTTQLGALTAHPAALLIVGGYGVLWFVFHRETFDWEAIATLAIWSMTLFIQR